MATFPTYAKLLHEGYRRARQPAVLRTDMETGPAKQAKIVSRVMIVHEVQYAFGTIADYQNFLIWFRDDIARGAGWFDWADPLTDAVKAARIVGGAIDEELPNKQMDVWVLRFKIEHWDG
ncbi:MAG: hypothetical protein AABZ67_05900 [Pseudomonadota bacterium]